MNWRDDVPPPPMEGRTITTIIVITLVIWVFVVLLLGTVRSDPGAMADRIEQQQQPE